MASRLGWVGLVLILGVQSFAENSLVALLQSTCKVTIEGQTGTGFFVRRGSVNFLVTAGHIFDKSSATECRLVIRDQKPQSEPSRRELTIPLHKEGKPLWKKHGSEDIAALPVVLPVDSDMVSIPFDRILKVTKAGASEIALGMEVWLPGYPAQLESNKEGWPVLRKGMVASYPLSPISKTPTMLIDIRSFGGDSGGAVFTMIKGVPYIAGMIVGMHRQTDRTTSAFEDRTVHTPLGLAIAVQGQVVAQTVSLFAP